MPEQKKRKVGRPSKYEERFNKMAYEACLLGATDKDLAKLFDIEEKTIYNWINEHRSFLQAIKDGREFADNKVAKSLYERALGYEHKEDKIFQHNGEIIIQPTVKHYPPDVNAASLWLRNRRPDLWRDQKNIEANIKEDKTITIKLDPKVDAMLADLREMNVIEGEFVDEDLNKIEDDKSDDE